MSIPGLVAIYAILTLIVVLLLGGRILFRKKKKPRTITLSGSSDY